MTSEEFEIEYARRWKSLRAEETKPPVDPLAASGRTALDTSKVLRCLYRMKRATAADLARATKVNEDQVKRICHQLCYAGLIAHKKYDRTIVYLSKDNANEPLR